jgi:hypothetical protein
MESTTQNQQTRVYEESIISETFRENLKTYLLNPLSAGLVGFAVFFSLIMITKLFGYIIGTNETFNLALSDVIYSLTGFLFVTGAKFFEFFGKED